MSLTGLEPAIVPLGGGSVIHYATETFVLNLKKNIYILPPPGIEPGTFRSSV